MSDNGAPVGFLTVAEVAAQLRLSTMTVYRLIHGGELPATRIGRSLRLRTSDVQRFLTDRYHEAG